MTLSESDRARLLAIESGLVERAFPPQLVVETTSHCNMRCIHCSHREMIREHDTMERWLWDKIVDEVGKEAPNTELWPTFYGEALILSHKGELWDRLRYAAAAGCRNLVLNSNGSLLGRWNNVDKVLDSPLKRFIVSLDGFSPETFEAIRVGGKRDEIYAAVEELLRKRTERGQQYPVVICQFSEMEANSGEVEAFGQYWRALGAEVKVRQMLEWAGTGTVRAHNLDHETSFRIACPWAANTMAIHQNGDVVACAVDYEGRFTVGNVEETSIASLWKQLGVQLRKRHRDHDWEALPQICLNCRDWQTAGARYDEAREPDSRPFWFLAGHVVREEFKKWAPSQPTGP